MPLEFTKVSNIHSEIALNKTPYNTENAIDSFMNVKQSMKHTVGGLE